MIRRALDTSEAAATIQTAILGRMSGAERLQLAIDMSLTARALARTRLRHDHPEWSEHEIDRALRRFAFAPRDLPIGYK